MGAGTPFYLTAIEMVAARVQVQKVFPKIGDFFEVTSKDVEDYNCIAWAANDTSQWWWPDPDSYWPPGVDRIETLESFISAFGTIGYQVCPNSHLEHGYEKVAIYCINNVPKHMARQLRTGFWTSKLGKWYDIQHTILEGVVNSIYGVPTLTMRRRTS